MKAKEQLPAADEAPPRNATWLTASQLIIADVIGIGVMAMAEAFAELGWLLGITCCALMLPLNLYSGMLVWRVNVHTYPECFTLADIALRAMGRGLYWLTAVLVYSFLFMTLGDYVLSLGLCLQQLFVAADLPPAVWTLVAAAVLLPFCQVRTLNAAGVLLWVNALTIVLAVALCLGALVAEGRSTSLARSGGSTHLVARGLGWEGLTSGLSKIAFAYVGVLMYPEIIAEMREPRDFPKAFYAGAPFQLSAFMAVGAVGYAYLGDAARGLLINAVPPGATSRCCALALFVHLVITYLIKGTVLARALHRRLAPASLNDTSRRGALVWLAITSALLAACTAVALAVPWFDDLSSLIGSLQTPLIGFCLPALFAYRARRAEGRATPPALALALAALFLFGLAFCVLGTTATLGSIAQRWRDGANDGAAPGLTAARHGGQQHLRARHGYAASLGAWQWEWPQFLDLGQAYHLLGTPPAPNASITWSHPAPAAHSLSPVRLE